ncbi:MAG: BACON domain-containing protein [Bacteroidales bacterium]|nr:BACON domain-containing protein [Bacteroidales bacterium]
MKKNVILITMAAVALLAACQKKVLSERETLDSRTRSTLEVQYALGGNTVQELKLSHSYALCELAVTVNNDGLRWKVESDSPWCKVIPGDHQGSGSVTLELAANESFDDRSGATLTFVAGDFRGFTIPVSQSGAAFIIGQPYFVADLDGGVYTVDVKTLTEKKDWTYESLDDWLSAEFVNEGAPDQGMVTKRLSLTAAANGNDSRLGTVKLSYGGETDELTLWQFGTDLSYDAGKIYFPSDSPAQLQFLAPRNVIKGANLPDYASQNVEQVAQNREKWTISFADNLSDCEERRDIDVSITLSNNTSSVVPFPQAVQDYTPAYGLMTAKGVQLFAQKVAAGESTSDWEKDGWVKMLNDIDMTGVTGWAGIGTEAHPFSGKFDGNGKSILNLKQSASGFFNVCAGESETNMAVIQNLTMGKSCSFVHAGASDESFGGIVNHAAKARVMNCSNLAPITFNGSGSGNAFIGGIAGWGMESVTIRGCHMEGKMTVSCEVASAQVGGIAGYALVVRDSDFSGSIVTEGATLTSLYVGGITSWLSAFSSVSNNAFMGSIEAGSASVASHYLGGLYAAVAANVTLNFDKANDMSSVSGSIKISSFKSNSETKLYAGGFVAYAEGGTSLSFKGYDVLTSFTMDETTTNVAHGCYIGGVLGGCDFTTPVTSLTFEEITTQGNISMNYKDGMKHGVVRNLFGGLAGFIHGQATFLSCVNNVAVGGVIDGSADNDCGKTTNNSHFISMGGLVGYAEGGDLTITSCKNRGVVTNLGYVNNVAPATTLASSYSQGQCAGGIIGGFDLHASPKGGKLTLSSCENNAKVSSFRGMIGGIVGFCQNVNLTSCNSKSAVDESKGNAYSQGGIAGMVVSGSFDGCTAKSDLRVGNGGSIDLASVGGIVARIYDGGTVSISNCSYYGTVNINKAASTAAKPIYQAGLVGYSSANTAVSNSRYGGRIAETTVTADNYLNYVFGNGLGTQTDTRLWDGN